jgi:hypothetical protein
MWEVRLALRGELGMGLDGGCVIEM